MTDIDKGVTLSNCSECGVLKPSSEVCKICGMVNNHLEKDE